MYRLRQPARASQPEQVYHLDLLQLAATQCRLETNAKAAGLDTDLQYIYLGGRKNLDRPQRLCSAVTLTIHPSVIEYTYFVVLIFPGNSTRCEKTSIEIGCISYVV